MAKKSETHIAQGLSAQRKFLAFAISQALLVSSVQAVSITVDSLTDDGDDCTLRRAIEAANTDAPVVGCVQGNGQDVIEFDPALNAGTISLIGGNIAITSSVSIQGPGANSLTVSGNSDDAIFIIFDGSYANSPQDVALSNLTLRNAGERALTNAENLSLDQVTIDGNTGNCGGGLFNVGTATITNSTLSNNSARFGGAIYNGVIGSYRGLMTIDRSVISSNSTSLNGSQCLDSAGAFSKGVLQNNRSGGGIFNRGSLAITNSTLSNNAATSDMFGFGSGGAIYNTGALSIDSTTLIGNAAGRGAGIAVGGLYEDGGNVLITTSTLLRHQANQGGALSNFSGTLTLLNTTVSDNTASGRGGGLITYVATTTTVTHSTLKDNGATYGGGLFHDGGAVTLDHTIIAGSLSGYDCFGTPQHHRSLIQDGTCNPSIQGDPLLEPLADNGGATPTHALLFGSPAIDAGAANCLTGDQRGVIAPADGNFDGAAICDIGAVEFSAGAVVNTLNDVVADEGLCSLREAVNSANTHTPSGATTGECEEFADAIVFDSALNGGTITLTGGQLQLNQSVAIHGPGANELTISGNNSSAILGIDDNLITQTSSVTVEGLTLSNGMAAVGGAIAIHRDQLTLRNSVLTNNNASYRGGAIYNFYGTVHLDSSTITDNTAGFYGGGIYSIEGSLESINSTLSSNAATSGGAIHNYRGFASLASSTVSANSAASDSMFSRGGGIHNNRGTITLSNSTLSMNSAGSSGGAVENQLGVATITDSQLISNNAYNGGALRNESGLVTLNRVGAYNNTAGNGGVMATFFSRETITDSTLSGNSAGFGGALYCDGCRFTMLRTTLSDNRALSGGGVFNAGDSAVLVNSTLSGNSAESEGGAISNSDRVFLTNVTLANNTAGIGGGIHQQAGSVELSNAIVAGNVGGDCVTQFGTIDNVDSLIEDASCNATLIGDPQLGPLADNGGITLTHALQPTSPAIDAGNEGVCEGINPPLDQRGAPRFADGDNNGVAACDIGAVEFASEPLPDLLFLDGFE